MNNLYSGMQNDLSTINLSGVERARAELHMRRAAAIVELLMGLRKAAPSQPKKSQH